MSLERAIAMKKKLSDLQRQYDRAVGGLESLERQLAEDWDCKTAKEADTLLDELASKETRLQKKYDKALARFEEKWGESLES